MEGGEECASHVRYEHKHRQPRLALPLPLLPAKPTRPYWCTPPSAAHLEHLGACCLCALQLSLTQECPDGLLRVVWVHCNIIPTSIIKGDAVSPLWTLSSSMQVAEAALPVAWLVAGSTNLATTLDRR